MPAQVPIPVSGDYWEQMVYTRMIVHSMAGNPTTAEVPRNQWAIYKNTTTGVVSIWVNDEGTMKSRSIV